MKEVSIGAFPRSDWPMSMFSVTTIKTINKNILGRKGLILSYNSQEIRTGTQGKALGDPSLIETWRNTVYCVFHSFFSLYCFMKKLIGAYRLKA